MLYQVNGKSKEGKNYSTRIEAKNPTQASKIAKGNLIQTVISVISFNKYNEVKNSWKMLDGKLIRTL